MTTLKISELSVGDWVRDGNGIIAKVRGIENWSNGYILNVQTVSGSICTLSATGALPIPITAEILEKNGLFRHERDDDSPERIVLTNHFIMARTYTDVDWWRVLIYDEGLHTKELFNGIIYSVHQLQHALNLAGIDKEINL